MLLALCAVFLALWLVSMSITLGGLAHLLLVAAVAVMLFHLWQSRNPI